MEMQQPTVDDFGGAPAATHDMACAVCWKRKAVLDLHTSRFLPCWECQRDGWRLANVARMPRLVLWVLMFWTRQK